MNSKHFKKIRIIEILRDFAINSTSHGIPNIARAKSAFLKIIWLFFFLISSTICSFLIFKAISNYCSHETITKLTNRYEFPAEFPTITICNQNIFASKDYLILFREQDQQLKGKKISKAAFHNFMKLNAFNLSDERKQNLGLRLKELIFDECFFRSQPFDFENDFVWIFNFEYGNCFIFNSGRNKTGHSVNKKHIDRIGKKSGLTFIADVGDSYFQPTLSTGLHIFIHNSSVEISGDDGIDVSTGSETSIAIK